MSLATLTTNPSDALDGSDLERVGEFLRDTPETAAEFRIPVSETPDADVTVGTFSPVLAAPYVQEVDYHAERAAQVVEAALLAERNHHAEVANAAGAVNAVRTGFLIEQSKQ